MSDAPTENVLRRKLGAHPTAPLGEPASAPLWREALPKVASSQLNLALAVISVRSERLDPDTLAARIDPKDLVIGLKGPGGAAGVAWFDPSVLSALIESLTLGEVRNTELADRTPTQTDAVLAGEALDGWFASLSDVSGPKGPAVLSARSGAHLPSVRAARLSLSDTPLDVIALHLDLGDGARAGTLHLAAPPGATDRQAGAIPEFPAALGAPVKIIAELARLDLPYGQIRSLAPGGVINLPLDVIGDVRLRGHNGVLAARGRLGQSGGFRAIRLENAANTAAPETAFVAPSAPEPNHSGLPEIDLAPPEEVPQLADLPDVSVATS